MFRKCLEIAMIAVKSGKMQLAANQGAKTVAELIYCTALCPITHLSYINTDR